MRNRGLIDDAEMLRLAYRFCGESTDIEEMLARGAKAAKTGVSSEKDTAVQAVRVNPDSGEESEENA
jgi:hypothetical protein